MKLNCRGSSQLFLCLALLMSLSGITIVTLSKLDSLIQNRVRLNALLCMRKGQYHQSKFIYNINTLNRAIQISYYTSKLPSPQVSTAAKLALEAMKLKQQVDLTLFYKDIYQLQECSKITIANVLLNSPYILRGKIKFKRSFDETVELTDKKEWNYFYSTNEKLSTRRLPTVFKSTIKIDNKFDRSVKIISKGYEI